MLKRLRLNARTRDALDHVIDCSLSKIRDGCSCLGDLRLLDVGWHFRAPSRTTALAANVNVANRRLSGATDFHVARQRHPHTNARREMDGRHLHPEQQLMLGCKSADGDSQA
jgi:hypothetical protein